MDVRIAIQQMIAAEAYAKQGKAGYFPTLSVGPNYTHQEFSKNSQFGSFLSGRSKITLMLLQIYLGKQIFGEKYEVIKEQHKQLIYKV